jgi:hypothetical protein
LLFVAYRYATISANYLRIKKIEAIMISPIDGAMGRRAAVTKKGLRRMQIFGRDLESVMSFS